MGDGTEQSPDRLALHGQLSDMVQLPAWIENLASRHSIPANVQFAMNLCLEEALANVIRHGYQPGCGDAKDHTVAVLFTTPRSGYFEFVVEDEAPPFNPLDAPELPALNSCDAIRVGGQGIRLMRQFADELTYEKTPTGNRLRIGFSAAGWAIQA